MKQIDISGKRYGNLTAIEPNPNNGRYWLFKCDCGTVKYIGRSNVVYGSTIGCGCFLGENGLKNRIKRMGLKMIGKKFNKLTVIEFSYRKENQFYWKCLCDCGNETIVPTNTLRFGKTKSCGCFLLTKNKPGISGLKQIYLIYKKTAKRRGIIFDLTIEEFKDITSKNCSYCGVEPSAISSYRRNEKTSEYTSYKFNGIDRIDSNKGYEKGNIAACCKHCNYIKNNSTVGELKNHVIKIYENLK